MILATPLLQWGRIHQKEQRIGKDQINSGMRETSGLNQIVESNTNNRTESTQAH